MDNIIFIIFVFLFIIVLLGLNVKINQEGFDDVTTAPPDNSVTTTVSFTPSFITDVTTAAATTATTPSFITDVTTAASTATTIPSFITNVTTAAATTPSFFTETTTPVSITTPTIGTSATTTVGTIATTTPVLSTAPTTTVAISSSTTTPPGMNFSNTSWWFDPKFIDYWANSFAPTELRYKPYNVTLYTITTNPDPNGILTPTTANPGIVFNNYLKIAFDNTNTDYNNFTQNPIVSVQTKVKNIPIGNYLMTYYVSSSTNTTDTQSISVTSGANSVIGTPFVLRNFVTGGTWIKQQFAFSVTDTTENTIQFQFELFDTKSPGFSIVAVGGIDIQSCGNQPCNIDCTTYYTDWGVCDITKGVSTRNAELISRNSDTTCPVPSTIGNCLDAVNFKNSLTGWNITTTPVDAITNNTIKIPVFTASTITNAYQFNLNNIPFNTPFTVVNFLNSTANTFTGNINPTATISTSLKLQAGNYRISYYVQSSETQQLINVTSVFGSGTSVVTTQVVPSNVVNPLEWYLVSTNILVATDSIVPIQFIFTLKDTKPLISSAIALGGISLSYCGNKPCTTSPPSITTTTPYSSNSTATPYSTNTTTPYSTTTNTPYSSNSTTTPYSTTTTTTTPYNTTTSTPYNTYNYTTAAPTTAAPTTSAPTTPAPTTPAPTTPAPCFTDWSECDTGNNITMDMLTDKMKENIQSFIDNYNSNNPSNDPYTLKKFVDIYNNTLSKSYTKTRKLNPNASPSCVNSATLNDLLMINCPFDCKFDGWNDWSTCNEKGTVNPPLIDKNSDYAKEMENKYPGIIDLLNDDIIQQYKEHSVRTRTRHTRPAQNGGKTCPPSKPETDFDCPIDCKYNGWSDWGECDKNSSTRTRTAITTPPSNGGATCTPGVLKDTTISDCPVDCKYNGWSDWSKCSGNSVTRKRYPITSPPVNNGVECTPGSIKDILKDDCPIDCKYKWSDWSKCDGNSTERKRDVLTEQPKNNGAKCTPGAKKDISKDDCAVDCKYNGWTQWSTCDGNSTERRRNILTEQPKNGGKACVQPNINDVYQNDCPVNCKYEWSDWSKCNGKSTQRKRDVSTIQPKNNGKACTPAATKDISLNDCPVNCVGSWGEWSGCSKKCGGGTKERTYTVTTPASNGGNYCTGTYANGRSFSTNSSIKDSQDCNGQPCDVQKMGAYGGSGGGSFDYKCSGNSYISKIYSMWDTADGYIHQLQGNCSDNNRSSMYGKEVSRWWQYLDFQDDVRCNNNGKLSGVVISKNPYAFRDGGVAGIQGICKDGSKPTVGMFNWGNMKQIDCPSGYSVSGLYGGSGNAIDSVGIYCKQDSE